jgi:hypothetical protein
MRMRMRVWGTFLPPSRKLEMDKMVGGMVQE